MKYGLVMEGGAMRGLFTAGVIDVLMENEITFDGAVGVSAGAAFGCNYKSNQPRRVIRYNTRFCHDKRFCSVSSLVKTGDMFGADFCYHEIPNKLDIFDYKTFNESPMEFYVVCTDVTTGKPVYRRCRVADDNELEWIRASASMPLASRIVEVGGMKLLDGGISDSIPLKFMEKTGYEKNVVILTQPRNYVKKKNNIIPLMKIAMRKYPQLINAMKNRHIMYNDELKYIRSSEQQGKAYVIAPDEKLPVGHIEHNQDILLEVYRIGRMTAMNKINEIKEFLDIK
ncbi:MAG: patatin family protein [Ruminococcus sp.]|nr:patatin family protein [Ruminococcus sp.]MBP3309855.1 patatin family protein [Ruminococcus sp.]